MLHFFAKITKPLTITLVYVVVFFYIYFFIVEGPNGHLAHLVVSETNIETRYIRALEGALPALQVGVGMLFF